MDSLRTLADKIKNYFNPQVSGTKGFWGTPVAQGMANVQNTIPQSIQKPIQSMNLSQIPQQTVNYLKQQPIINNPTPFKINIPTIGQMPSLLQNAGQQMQKMPDTTIKYNNPYMPTYTSNKILGKVAEFATGLPGELVRSTGRTTEQIGNIVGGKKYTGNKFEDVLNVASVFPIGRLATEALPEIKAAANLLKKTANLKTVEALKNIVADIQTKGNVVNQEDLLFLENKVVGLLGEKVRTATTKQLANLMDIILKRTGQTKNEFNLGLSVKNIREGTESIPGVKLTKERTQIGLPGIGVPEKQSGKIVAANAEMSLATKIKIQAEQAKRDFIEWQKALFSQEAPRTTTGAINSIVKSIKTNTQSPFSNPEGLKDISGIASSFKDIFRNFRSVYGRRFEEVKKNFLDPLFIKGKTALLDDQQHWVTILKRDIVKGLGITKGSKMSADIQRWGEKLLTEVDLIKKYGQTGANKIIQADKWFRTSYDQLLKEVNDIRAKIYPNDPTKIIPRREDYYRHFRELAEGIDSLLNTFNTATDIGSPLVGKSYQTKPLSKFLSFAQQRLGGKTEFDAVGGFIDYIKAQTYAKNIDPYIGQFRKLSEELATNTTKTGGMNNFILYLQRFADDLAGKTNPIDKSLQEIGGRKAFNVLNWLNSRVKSNTILYNASSSLAQIMNLPQGIADVGPINAIKGISRTLASIISKNVPMEKSIFLRERYNNIFSQFNRGLIANGKKLGAWMVTVLDEIGTRIIWNMEYVKALGQKIANPINYADEATRRMVGGRGIGEQALIQRALSFQLVAPFQLEVTNAWHVIGDFIGEKAFGKLITLALTSFAMNRVISNIRGNDVSFDPINATLEGIDAFKKENNKGIGALKFGGRLAGEVLSNSPLGQTFAATYPEFGATVGDIKLPTREELFGKGDPTRYGSGLLVVKGLQDPLSKIIPPYGGTQLKRSIQGVGSYMEGVAKTASNKVQFPIEQNIHNLIKSGLYGKYSTTEGQRYGSENLQPLGDVQSVTFLSSNNPIDRKTYYENVLNQRVSDAQQKTIEDRAAELVKSGQLDSIGGNKEGKLKRAIEKQLVEQGVTQINDAGEGSMVIGDKFLYWDNVDKDTKVVNIADREAQQKDADWSLTSDRLKRAGDAEKWISNAELRVMELQSRQTKLNPVLDKVEITKLQNSIEDLQSQIIKYKGYGNSFAKPKAPAKVSIAKVSAPKVQTVKISKPKFPKVKIAKTPTLKKSKSVKIAKYKPKGIKIKFSSKPTLGG